MEAINISIKQQETGEHIHQLLLENGYTPRDVQQLLGFSTPMAVYKWFYGQSLPSIDNLLILSRALHTTIDDILVTDGDFHFYKKQMRGFPESGRWSFQFIQGCQPAVK